MSIKDNVEKVREKIEKAALKSGRKPEEIILLAASKTQPVEKIKEAYESGIRYFGENRVQEGIKKIEALESIGDIHWHLIGGLQTNKAKYAVRYFEMIHSVDREGLADELDKRAGKIGKKQDVLVEVNLGMEETKYGVEPDRVEQLFGYLLDKKNLTCSVLCVFLLILKIRKSPVLTLQG